MRSTLIRYTSKKYADSILRGDLYLSSLSTFWDFRKGKISEEDIVSGKVSKEDIQRAEEYSRLNQQDFSEGVASQVPKTILNDLADPTFSQHIAHDVRFRIEAYGYCNLLCFFRVDADEVNGNIPLDADNIALLAKEMGIAGINSYQDFQKLPTCEKMRVVKSISEPNLLLNPNHLHIVQLPTKEMDGFGDLVMVIKNEMEFIQRVLDAVKSQGGECVIGDIRYHKILDRPVTNPHVTLVSSNSFNLKGLAKNITGIIRYGSLDKYDRYAAQKEWRICWLPKEHNNEPKILHIGDTSDIIDLVDSKNIRRYLLKRYSGHIPGVIFETRKETWGTVSYKNFKDIVEGIDGKCRLILDVG